MRIKNNILSYLLVHRKENRYRLASALKINIEEVTKALKALEEEGRIEIKGGRAILVRGKEIRKKKRKKKEEKLEEVKGEELEEEREEEMSAEKREEVGEQPEETEELPEETPTEKESEEVSEEPTQEERIKGTVKFFNPDKGFGFITGDDGKEYYVHKSALKEGVTIEANDRVSFKPVEGDKGPKAEEVEWVSQA